ncbi:MAG: SipW-dependent-type signal peptide-containing protein [Firmicutes bacterium]|nr:SipW-dependent-type signal peptide-containing protein [Bacillota bacterium]
MKKKRKLNKLYILFPLCVCLIAGASIMATLAFLTDEEEALNVFTTGKVDIGLTEAVVNTEGEPLKDGAPVADVRDADRTKKGNAYHLIPGLTYVKDPTITVEPDSEEAFVRVLVSFNCMRELDEIFKPDGADLLKIFNGYDSQTWKYVDAERDDAENTIIYEFRYKEKVKNEGREAVKLDPLFGSFTVPETMTGDQLASIKDLKIRIKGQAIQTAVMDTEEDAWAAFEQQYPN